jgi:hypothetical protein
MCRGVDGFAGRSEVVIGAEVTLASSERTLLGEAPGNKKRKSKMRIRIGKKIKEKSKI